MQKGVLTEKLEESRTQVTKLTGYIKRSEEAAVRINQLIQNQSKELDDIRKANEKLEEENEQYKEAFAFVIPGPCFIGLKGYEASEQQ